MQHVSKILALQDTFSAISQEKMIPISLLQQFFEQQKNELAKFQRQIETLTISNYFELCPEEIISYIFSFTEPEDLVTLPSVCIRFQSVLQNQNIWRTSCIRWWNSEVLSECGCAKDILPLDDMIKDCTFNTEIPIDWKWLGKFFSIALVELEHNHLVIRIGTLASFDEEGFLCDWGIKLKLGSAKCLEIGEFTTTTDEFGIESEEELQFGYAWTVKSKTCSRLEVRQTSQKGVNCGCVYEGHCVCGKKGQGKLTYPMA
jgi:hypothetical protein